MRLGALVAAGLMLATTPALAVPVTLNGLGLEKSWIDTEAAFDEMPAFVWGSASANDADEIGLYVAFDDGTTGTITWRGVAPYWNTNSSGFAGMIVTSTSGFFDLYASSTVHFLYNTPVTTSYPEALPIAWDDNPATPFGFNVELDYNEFNGSEFRSGVTGWVSAEWATYSSTASSIAPVPGPLPAVLLLSGLGLLAVGRRKT